MMMPEKLPEWLAAIEERIRLFEDTSDYPVGDLADLLELAKAQHELLEAQHQYIHDHSKTWSAELTDRARRLWEGGGE